ncbi:hypothetical protein E1B28_001756 [Marasmius oreades]|uniref:F-box domain-containing protein n=1 Tax=Marasmius oreades TaxID=181124 RepID=A0A9P7V478_9AGAR|nr:uncharacterized protein E1B28_001756 [Marasmius oreades]KAG7099963.1 hypothetical protein E1B28_001756 [Marasmius oreades]
MSTIFRYCIYQRLMLTTTTMTWSSRISWLNVTQVCRQWRSIALDSASTWSLIDFSHHSLTHEMILRSKAAPLDIEVMPDTLMPYHGMLDGLKEALSHIDRIRRLVLHTSPSLSDSGTLFSNLTKPAPLLQKLEVYGGPYISLPNNLFGGKASRLRELKVSGLHFPWSGSLLKNLTTLALNEPHNEPLVDTCFRCPSTKQLIEVLQEMPGLEVLELTNSLPVHTSEKMLPRLVVELSRLRRLRLSGTLLNCTEVLRNITFPPSAALHITCKSFFATIITDLDAIPFFDRLCQIYSASSTGEDYFKSLSIDAKFPPFSLRAGDPTRRPEKLGELLSTLLHVDLNIYDIAHRPTFRAAARTFPLGQLEELRLAFSLGDICLASDFVELFGSLESLKTLALDQRGIRNFLDALRSCDCGSDGEPPSGTASTSKWKLCRLVFPALTTMKLTEVDFEEDFDGVGGFVDFLSFRRRHGKPIEKLVLTSCIQLYQGGVDRLTEVVQDVEWDGSVETYEDDEGDEDSDLDDDDFWGHEPFYYGSGDLYADDESDGGWLDPPFDDLW